MGDWVVHGRCWSQGQRNGQGGDGELVGERRVGRGYWNKLF
jgi:hypothetical protein